MGGAGAAGDYKTSLDRGPTARSRHYRLSGKVGAAWRALQCVTCITRRGKRVAPPSSLELDKRVSYEKSAKSRHGPPELPRL